MKKTSINRFRQIGPKALIAIMFFAPLPSLADKSRSHHSKPTIEFEHATATAVLNVVDEDVQILFLAATETGIERLTITGPEHKVRLSSNFRDDGVGQADVRFDTTEPNLEELMEAYPAGNYRFKGTDVEGNRLHSAVPLDYEFAEPATDLFPFEDATDIQTVGLIVYWTLTEEPAAIHVAIENEETGGSVAIDLPGDATEFAVPNGFLEAGTEYVVDVITISDSGNYTVIDALFTTVE